MRLEHVTRTPTNGSAVLLSRVSVFITRPVYCPMERVLVTWYGRISYIYTFWYNFDTVLCQFLETGTSYVLNVSFNSWDSQVSTYTPFHFSFKVPLRNNIYTTLIREGFTKNAIKHGVTNWGWEFRGDCTNFLIFDFLQLWTVSFFDTSWSMVT